MEDKYIVVFGGCSLDVTIQENPTGSYTGSVPILAPGGKGSNQAVAASRAGAKVVMITLLGKGEEKNEYGLTESQISSSIIRNLNDNGVDTSFVELKENLGNDVSIIHVSKEGDNEIYRQGHAINEFYCGMIDKNAELIRNASFVISQLKAPIEVIRHLAYFCYDNNIPLVLTPCRPDKLKSNLDLIGMSTFITANEKECKTIFETDDIEECVRRCRGKLIVTLGEKGLMYYEDGRVKTIPAFAISNVIDTTGAGDTLNGNFVACLLQGMTVEEALVRGSAASAIKIQSKTAQNGMPTKEKRDEFLSKLIKK